MLINHLIFGEMAEWSKAHAWKVCILRTSIESSNLSPSATWVIGSAVEHLVYTEEVSGSNPLSPTIQTINKCGAINIT